jgi:hypothetical protein
MSVSVTDCSTQYSSSRSRVYAWYCHFCCDSSNKGLEQLFDLLMISGLCCCEQRFVVTSQKVALRLRLLSRAVAQPC